MSLPGITFGLLDGSRAAGHAEELRVLHDEVYDGRLADDSGAFAGRFRVHRRQPGFVLAEARHGGFLVGYAYGMPLRPSTSWWRDLTVRLPDEVTAEQPGRTFALIELLVRAPWRRQGVGRELHDLILSGRSEDRATLIVASGAFAAQSAFQSWGWRKVARTHGSGPGPQVSDVLVISLPPAHTG